MSKKNSTLAKQKPSLSLSELIESATREIVEARNRGAKSGYKVQELCLELHVEASVGTNGRLSLSVLGLGAQVQGDVNEKKSHKITLKLAPMNKISKDTR